MLNTVRADPLHRWPCKTSQLFAFATHFEQESIMKKLTLVSALAALVASPAMAGLSFVNGGFENGNLDGWLFSSDSGSASYAALPAGSTSNPSSSNGGLSAALVGFGVDAHTGINTTYGGSYAARVGDDLAWGYSGGGTIYNRMKQTGAVVAEADGSVGFVYFAWAAIEKESGHSTTATPFFQVKLTNDTQGGPPIYDVSHYETDGGAWTDVGFWKHSTNGNPLDPTGWNVVGIDLTGLAVVGDMLTLEVIARDCTPSAHAMYVYVDGFGGKPPVQGVPEPATLAMLGLGLVGLAATRRRKSA